MNYIKKYPKISILLLVYLVVFITFSFSQIILENILLKLSTLGIFISGAMYTYSFTASIGTGAFLILAKSYSPILLSIIGGIGAGLADVSILKFLEKFGFSDEFNNLSKEKSLCLLCNKVSFLTSRFFLTIAGIITLASPLPDELGVILIERGKSISSRHLFIIGVISNTIGIFILTKFVN